MFGLRVTYLRGSVTAADIRTGNDKDRVEWPPHPDRLFSALVQAWGDRGASEAEREALLWLERLGPPHIRCGQTLDASTVLQFVPVNDACSPMSADAEKGRKPEAPITGTLLGRRRQPRRLPSAGLSDDGAVVWWPAAIPASRVRASLGSLAEAIASLGHSSCLVAVAAVDEVSQEPTWVPRADGAQTLRVPVEGRLQEMCAAYAASPRRRPPPGTWASYGQPLEQQPPRRGHHEDLLVFRLAGEHAPLPLEATSAVMAVWRRALLQRADQPVAEVVSGHAPGSTPEAPRPTQRAHLALLPLPDVGHPYAGAHLLGLAAALPGGLDAAERTACLRALGRVESLTLGSLGVWRLARSTAEERRRALQPETWRRPGRVWASVTPLVFGRYPRTPWGTEATDLVADACEIAGLPRPSEVTVAPTGWVLGVPPAPRFPILPGRMGKPRRLQAHVRLVFPEPIAGPVLVGAGRHQGYGLFRRLGEVS